MVACILLKVSLQINDKRLSSGLDSPEVYLVSPLQKEPKEITVQWRDISLSRRTGRHNG